LGLIPSYTICKEGVYKRFRLGTPSFPHNLNKGVEKIISKLPCDLLWCKRLYNAVNVTITLRWDTHTQTQSHMKQNVIDQKGASYGFLFSPFMHVVLCFIFVKEDSLMCWSTGRPKTKHKV